MSAASFVLIRDGEVKESEKERWGGRVGVDGELIFFPSSGLFFVRRWQERKGKDGEELELERSLPTQQAVGCPGRWTFSLHLFI